MLRSYLPVFYFFSLLFFSGCATHQDMLGTKERLSLLEVSLKKQEEESLKKLESIFLAEGEVKEELQLLRSSYARLRSDMDSLYSAVQQLQGGMEKSYFQEEKDPVLKDQLSKELGFLKEDYIRLDARVSYLCDYIGLEEGQDKKLSEDSSLKKVLKEDEKDKPLLDLDALYAEAKDNFDRGELEKAKELFHELLERFADSSLANNAQFWIAETYYKEAWYEKAVLEYQKVIDRYPKGNKVPSALLKQGLAFEKLGQKANARLILEELQRRYPDSSESLIGQRKLRQL